jgi:hypothetical protein
MADETPSTPTPEPVSASKSIGIKVAEQISAAGSEILDRVVEKLAEVEIAKRADALLNAVNAAVTTQRELYKVKPDQQSYDASGKVVSETYSKARFEEKKKLEEKLAKIEAAVDKAVTKGDYSGVLGLKSE